jgi:mutator protein MutT
MSLDGSHNYEFQIRVTGILIHDGKLLIVRQHLSDKRQWSLPGGRLEHGETMEKAVIREIYEETGITAEADRLLYVCDVSPMNRVIHISFMLKYISGTICLPDNTHDENPISDVRFANIDSLTEYGFSDKFITLIRDGFPNRGCYMGDKANIGLGI